MQVLAHWARVDLASGADVEALQYRFYGRVPVDDFITQPLPTFCADSLWNSTIDEMHRRLSVNDSEALDVPVRQ